VLGGQARVIVNAGHGMQPVRTAGINAHVGTHVSGATFQPCAPPSSAPAHLHGAGLHGTRRVHAHPHLPTPHTQRSTPRPSCAHLHGAGLHGIRHVHRLADVTSEYAALQAVAGRLRQEQGLAGAQLFATGMHRCLPPLRNPSQTPPRAETLLPNSYTGRQMHTCSARRFAFTCSTASSTLFTRMMGTTGPKGCIVEGRASGLSERVPEGRRCDGAASQPAFPGRRHALPPRVCGLLTTSPTSKPPPIPHFLHQFTHSQAPTTIHCSPPPRPAAYCW